MSDLENNILQTSPIMDVQNKQIEKNNTINNTINNTENNTENKNSIFNDKSIYTYILAIIIVGLVIYLLYYSYSCFYENDYNIDTFIEKPIKSETDDDIQQFNMDDEVDNLKALQKKYLLSINSKKKN